jgi:hypothetical protein
MTESGRRWLILVHQLPARPSNLRVRIWRRLQQVGAVVLRNSLYVLPAGEEAREDFNWVREEIRSAGGQVSVLEAAAVDGYTDEELVAQFRRLGTSEYETLAKAIHALGKESTRRDGADGIRKLRTLRERFESIKARDYFEAPGRDAVEQALIAAARRQDGSSAAAPTGPLLKAKDYRGRVWVTRPRPGIDRFASAWFVREFVDPDARFGFFDATRVLRRNEIPYDMPDVEFGHQGAHCTFETLMRRFGVDRTGLARLAGVVHDLDFKESRHGMPECAAVARLVDGLRVRFDNDAELLEHGMVMIDALYRSFASERAPRPTQARRARRPRPK